MNAIHANGTNGLADATLAARNGELVMENAALRERVHRVELMAFEFAGICLRLQTLLADAQGMVRQLVDGIKTEGR